MQLGSGHKMEQKIVLVLFYSNFRIMCLLGITVLSLGFLILPGSCNKNNGFDRLDQLINKEWHLVSVQESTDITKPCDQDDVLRFTDAKHYTYNTGANICEGFGDTDIRTTTGSIAEHSTVLKPDLLLGEMVIAEL